MYQHCQNPFAIKQRWKSVDLSPKQCFLGVETTFRHTFPSSDLQCLPPDDPRVLCANTGIRLLATHSLRQNQPRNCCHGNDTTGVIMFLLWCTFLVPSLKNTALIFLGLFSIECCAVLVEPPMTWSLSLQKRKYLLNEKRYSKMENAILLYFEKPCK